MIHLKNNMNSSKHCILLMLLYVTKRSHLNAGYITVSELEERVSARYKEKACGLHFLYTTAVQIVKLQQQKDKKNYPSNYMWRITYSTLVVSEVIRHWL